jgi:hypothetical protein
VYSRVAGKKEEEEEEEGMSYLFSGRLAAM